MDTEDASYSWTQVAGTPVSLSDPNVATPTFQAPALLAGDDLVFEVKVNRGGEVVAETVVIHVSATGTVTRGEIAPVEWRDVQPPVHDVDADEPEQPKKSLVKVVAGLFAFLFGTDVTNWIRPREPRDREIK